MTVSNAITPAPRRPNRVRPYYRLWERRRLTGDALSMELLRRAWPRLVGAAR